MVHYIFIFIFLVTVQYDSTAVLLTDILASVLSLTALSISSLLSLRMSSVDVITTSRWGATMPSRTSCLRRRGGDAVRRSEGRDGESKGFFFGQNNITSLNHIMRQ